MLYNEDGSADICGVGSKDNNFGGICHIVEVGNANGGDIDDGADDGGGCDADGGGEVEDNTD